MEKQPNLADDLSDGLSDDLLDKNQPKNSRSDFKTALLDNLLPEIAFWLVLAFPVFFAWVFISFGLFWLLVPLLACCGIGIYYWQKRRMKNKPD